MNSLLDFIYVLFFVPSDVFLYISLFFISIISLSIIVRHSYRTSQEDLEASSPLRFTARSSSQPPASQQQPNNDPQTGPQPDESETAPTEFDEAYQFPSQRSSHTSKSIHDSITPELQLPQPTLFGSQQDSLLETGSMFNNEGHDRSSPLLPDIDDVSDVGISSLDLNN